MTQDSNFLVKSGGEIRGEFQSYGEAQALWAILYKHDKAVVIQDVKASR